MSPEWRRWEVCPSASGHMIRSHRTGTEVARYEQMRHLLLAAGLSLGTACTVGQSDGGPTGDDQNPDESGCFSQSSLPLQEGWVVSWGGGLADETYDIAALGDDAILMGGFFEPA